MNKMIFYKNQPIVNLDSVVSVSKKPEAISVLFIHSGGVITWKLGNISEIDYVYNEILKKFAIKIQSHEEQMSTNAFNKLNEV